MTTSIGVRFGNGNVTLVETVVREAGQEVWLMLGFDGVNEECKKLVENAARMFRNPCYVRLNPNTLIVVCKLTGHSGTAQMESLAEEYTTGLLGSIKGAATSRLDSRNRRVADSATSAPKNHSKERSGFFNLGSHQRRH